MCDRTCPECKSEEHTIQYSIDGTGIYCDGCQAVLAFRFDVDWAPIDLTEDEQDAYAAARTFVMAGAEAKDPADDVLFGKPLTNEPVGVTEEYERAFREASGLATWLWKTYYKDDAPNWGLCDTAAGIITQIDNMVAGLEKKPVAAQGITISREDFEDVIGFMRPLIAKWRHDDAGKSLGELFDRLSAAIGERG